MFIRCLVTSISMFVSFGVQSRASVILSESFDYPDGILQEVASEKWKSHSGTDNQVDVSNHWLVLTGSESQDVNIELDGQTYLPDSEDSLYCRFTVRFTELPSRKGGYFAHFKDARSGFRGRIWAQAEDPDQGTFRLAISSATGANPIGVHESVLRLETDYRIVCRLSVSDSMATLWVDPLSETSPSVSSDSGSGLEIASFAFRQASGIGTIMVKDLLVGTVFSDVMPASDNVSDVKPTSGDGSSVQAPSVESPVPSILRQPQSISVLLDTEVKFSVSASGTEPLEYQWRFNDLDIDGATEPTLLFPAAAPNQQGDYRVVVRNANGTATSASATLKIVEAPAIQEAPRSLAAREGQDIALSVTPSGTEPFVYQWRYNGERINGATSKTLVLASVSVDQAGEYSVSVSNEGGEVVSEPAMVTVAIPNPPEIRFTNSLFHLVRPGETLVNTFTEHALRPTEELTMQVHVTDPRGEILTVRAGLVDLPASAHWIVLEDLGTEWNGEFTFQPAVEDSGTSLLIWIEAENADGLSRAEWRFYVPIPEEQGVVVSEFLANPPASGDAAHFNPLHRADPPPSPSSNDEFVELVNTSDAVVDLSGWTISDSVAVRHRFEGSVLLKPFSAIVVYGGPREGARPQLEVQSFPASEGVAGLALNNSGGDTIVLRNSDGDLIGRIAYAGLASDGSLTRSPDLNSEFVPHSTVSALFSSPGLTIDGRLFEPPPTLQVAPMVLRAGFAQGDGFVLMWNVEPGRPYSVLESFSIGGPYVPVASGITFTGEDGHYSDNRPIEDARFYRVSTP